MAHRIVASGFATTLWARRPESLEPFTGTAAEVASSRRALGAARDLVRVCVVDDAEDDFPGVVDLRYRFALDGELIAELVIAP